MSGELRPQEWFEMSDLRRRLFSRAVWVPLREYRTRQLEDGAEEAFGAGGVAFPADKRAVAETLGWSDIGLGHEGGPYAFENGRYKPAEIYQYHDGEDLGVELVFVQHIGAGHERVWHVSQDLIIALGLLQEGDVWVRPQEGYVEVVRQHRGPTGQITAIEIRSEFLRDYLAARDLAFRLATYRQRVMVTKDASHIQWPEDGFREEGQSERFFARVYEVDAKGGPYEGGIAVFHVSRTDVDVDEDVPVFGPENDNNTAAITSHWRRTGPRFYRVEGEFWRQEWIEPADRSERVRGDDSAEVITFRRRST